jgi:hypothetical protein
MTTGTEPEPLSAEFKAALTELRACMDRESLLLFDALKQAEGEEMLSAEQLRQLAMAEAATRAAAAVAANCCNDSADLRELERMFTKMDDVLAARLNALRAHAALARGWVLKAAGVIGALVIMGVLLVMCVSLG